MWRYGDENLKKWRARYEWSCWTIESNAPSGRSQWAVVSNCVWAVVVCCIWCKTLLAVILSWLLVSWCVTHPDYSEFSWKPVADANIWKMAAVSKDNKVHFYVSPFQRTLQTASWVANILTHVFFFFRRWFLKPHIFLLRGAEHHFFEFRSITSGACLGRSTDSRTRIWQFARPGALELGGNLLSMVTPYSPNFLHVWQDFCWILGDD